LSGAGKMSPITELQLEILQDIFLNTERLDKIAVTICNNDITIQYTDIDEEWLKELQAAERGV
jgi:4-hydroxy-3-methylbut-2-enyl diphosphate reductase IspH